MSHDPLLGPITPLRKDKVSLYPKTFTCSTCRRSFTTKGSLDFHINSIHLRAYSFACDLCPRVFSQAGNLKTHRFYVHCLPGRFSCRFCKKTFKRKAGLIHHSQMQHPQPPQTFHPPAQIEIVQNPLLLNTSSLQHIVTSGTSGGLVLSGGKPKRKNFIPLQTISETDLIRQVLPPTQQVTVRALDGTPGGTPVDLGLYHTAASASSPGKIVNLPPGTQLITTTSSSSIAAHNKKKKHACTLCDKAFAQIINLRTHVSTVHEGKKNYPCPECDKNFTQKGNLKAHITTIHQKLKNFQCVYCHKLFSQKGNMKTHIKNTHS